jgi:hypothetical protein
MLKIGDEIVINQDLLYPEILCGDKGTICSGPSGLGYYTVWLNGDTWLIKRDEMELVEGGQDVDSESATVQV